MSEYEFIPEGGESNEMSRQIAFVALGRLLDAIDGWAEDPHHVTGEQLWAYAHEVREALEKHTNWPREDARV